MQQAREAKPSDTPEKRPVDAVLMSGGAPNSPLMAGFLFALLEEGKMFKRYHTAGAGTLMALLSLAPKASSIARCEEPDPDRTRALEKRREAEGKPLSDTARQVRARGMKALKAWIDVGIADDIYQHFPVNFKLFHKPGPFAPVFTRLAQRYKLDEPGERSDDPFARLRDAWLGRLIDTPDRRRVYNELVDLAFAAVTPSTLSPKSKGLAAHLPFLEEIVDFEMLQNEVPVHVCVNAFNMATGEMEEFYRPVIDGRHIRAAFSMPFIYPPAQIDTDYYSEGADHEPINFAPLIREREEEWVKRLPALAALVTAAMQEKVDVERELAAAKSQRKLLRARLRIVRDAPSPTDEERSEIESEIESLGKEIAALRNELAKSENDLRNVVERFDEKVAAEHVVDRVVLLDVMGSLSPYLVRPPRGLWDAYVISIMTPVVALAKKQIQFFKVSQELFEKTHGYRHFELLEVSYDIPSYAQPYVMDWSRSNLEILFDVGYKTGREFLEEQGADALVDIEDAWAPEAGAGHDH